MNKKKTIQLRKSLDSVTESKKSTPDLRSVVLIAAGLFLLASRIAGITIPSWGTINKHVSSEPLFNENSITADARHIIYQLMPINDVGREILISLPDIGPKLADKIIAQRLRLGRIRTAEELLEIPGISEKKLKRLLPEITFDSTNR